MFGADYQLVGEINFVIYDSHEKTYVGKKSRCIIILPPLVVHQLIFSILLDYFHSSLSLKLVVDGFINSRHLKCIISRFKKAWSLPIKRFVSVIINLNLILVNEEVAFSFLFTKINGFSLWRSYSWAMALHDLFKLLICYKSLKNLILIRQYWLLFSVKIWPSNISPFVTYQRLLSILLIGWHYRFGCQRLVIFEHFLFNVI